MINKVVTAINGQLAGLSWTDKVGSIVHPLKIKKGTGEDIEEKTIPVCFNNNPTTCSTSKYIDYCPNSKYKSVLYWENRGETVTRQLSKSRQLVEANLRLVVWAYLTKINKTLTNADKLIGQLKFSIPRKYNVFTPEYLFFQVHELTTVKEPGIFGEYSYQEGDKQYLIYPYDYFALDLNVQFVDFICSEDITIDASCLNV